MKTCIAADEIHENDTQIGNFSCKNLFGASRCSLCSTNEENLQLSSSQKAIKEAAWYWFSRKELKLKEL